MAEVKLRLNLDAEEVELVVDGQVALTSGTDVLASWVKAVNDKHRSLDEPVPEKVVDEKPVEHPAEEVKTEVDTSSESVVD